MSLGSKLGEVDGCLLMLGQKVGFVGKERFDEIQAWALGTVDGILDGEVDCGGCKVGTGDVLGGAASDFSIWSS